jgi:hypothetical protein
LFKTSDLFCSEVAGDNWSSVLLREPKLVQQAYLKNNFFSYYLNILKLGTKLKQIVLSGTRCSKTRQKVISNLKNLNP